MKSSLPSFMNTEAFKSLFGTVPVPNLLADFDAIGFDGDYTLIAYKVKEHQKMQCKVTAEVMVKKRGYPKSILEITEADFNYTMNGVVLDGNTGCTAKLGTGNTVLRAFLGSRKLAQREIEEIYGKPPVMPNYDMNVATDLKNNYMCALTYFKCAHTVIFQKAVDLIIAGKLTKTYAEVINDLAYAIKKTFYNWNKDRSVIKNMFTYGPYYPEITKRPFLYLEQCPDVRKSIELLKEKGKIVFFITNSHYDYMDCLMSFAYGPDWKSMFDYIIVNSKKPGFFMKGSTAPAFLYDPSQKSCKGKWLDGEVMKKGVVYLEGNYTLLEEAVKKETGIKEPRMLYIGDNYVEDSIAPALLPNWKAVTVVQELCSNFVQKHIIDEKGCQEMACLFDYETNWGPYFVCPTEAMSIWINELLKLKVFPLPSIRCLSILIKQ